MQTWTAPSKTCAHGDSRLTVLRAADSLSDVDACNRGLSQRQSDAVILAANARVTEGWLSELAAVAHSEERIACAWPISNIGAIGSRFGSNSRIRGEPDEETQFKTAFSGLPRSTTTPRPDAVCVYCRDEMIDAVGSLDATFTSCDCAILDWVMRALALGFFVKRANHAFVVHADSLGRVERDPLLLDRGPAVLQQRNHEHRAQAAAFNKTLDGQLAAHAAEFQRTGKLRVAYDLRHLPPQSVGTRTYAVNLARALAGLPQIELTLLVASPIQADGLDGRVVTEEQWTDDVAVIHKPAQVFDRRALAILFGSCAHVVITYQDMISYRIPIVFPSDREFEAYRTTSGLSLQAAQAIVVYSESTAREIASEFGIPRRKSSLPRWGSRPSGLPIVSLATH